jgi:alkaline phosphatase D
MTLNMVAIDRRKFLGALAAVAAGCMLPGSIAAAQPGLDSYPFLLGVASGSPLPDGFVLWTRLIGRELAQHNVLDVRWEVFEDGRPDKIVAQGRTPALADLAHSVHVEVGGLEPDCWYGYRFMIEDAVSPIGRTRTLPLPDAAVDRLRFAYASCQRWEDGYYAAYRHMLAESLDLVVFVGDYIYEYASREESTARSHALPHIRTLADYRDRYALYKSDPDLQRMHAACPWLVTWDDHEVENNYAGVLSVEGTEDLAAKRVAAYQAYYEHMPLRACSMIRGLAGLRHEGALQIYNRVDFGRLASFHVLDNRQYRDPPLCGTNPDSRRASVCQSPEVDMRSMLGLEQEHWLDNGLKSAAKRGTQWNVIAQQTVFSPRNYKFGPGGEFFSDAWDGYPAARKRLLESIARHRPGNPMVIGGDIHHNWVADVHHDPYDVRSPVLASEFCGTSISSRGMSQDRVERIAAASPHNLFTNAERRGYGVIELGREKAEVRLRVLDEVKRADADIATLATFRVEDGRPKIIRA